MPYCYNYLLAPAVSIYSLLNWLSRAEQPETAASWMTSNSAALGMGHINLQVVLGRITFKNNVGFHRVWKAACICRSLLCYRSFPERCHYALHPVCLSVCPVLALNSTLKCSKKHYIDVNDDQVTVVTGCRVVVRFGS